MADPQNQTHLDAQLRNDNPDYWRYVPSMAECMLMIVLTAGIAITLF